MVSILPYHVPLTSYRDIKWDTWFPKIIAETHERELWKKTFPGNKDPTSVICRIDYGSQNIRKAMKESSKRSKMIWLWTSGQEKGQHQHQRPRRRGGKTWANKQLVSELLSNLRGDDHDAELLRLDSFQLCLKRTKEEIKKKEPCTCREGSNFSSTLRENLFVQSAG